MFTYRAAAVAACLAIAAIPAPAHAASQAMVHKLVDFYNEVGDGYWSLEGAAMSENVVNNIEAAVALLELRRQYIDNPDKYDEEAFVKAAEIGGDAPKMSPETARKTYHLIYDGSMNSFGELLINEPNEAYDIAVEAQEKYNQQLTPVAVVPVLLVLVLTAAAAATNPQVRSALGLN